MEIALQDEGKPMRGVSTNSYLLPQNKLQTLVSNELKKWSRWIKIDDSG